MSDGGKGSSPRPYSVDQKTFANNWDLIFKKKDPKEIDDAIAEDEAFKLIEKKNITVQPSTVYPEYDGPNRNTSNF